ncbi:MAG: hypothetical protein R3B83_04075 [Nitrospirales bacterium]|nr:hypothetical protein [Nitrospirales bacterium]
MKLPYEASPNSGRKAAEKPPLSGCAQLITAAIQSRVTDIHVEPDEQYLRVRMRIDGVLMQEI